MPDRFAAWYKTYQHLHLALLLCCLIHPCNTYTVFYHQCLYTATSFVNHAIRAQSKLFQRVFSVGWCSGFDIEVPND